MLLYAASRRTLCAAGYTKLYSYAMPIEHNLGYEYMTPNTRATLQE